MTSQKQKKNLSKGYITVATKTYQFVIGAKNLCESILDYNEDAKVTLFTDQQLYDQYYSELDMFVHPKPFPSWTLDSNGDWQPPVAKPADYVPHNRGGNYLWNESGQSWDANPDYTPYTP